MSDQVTADIALLTDARYERPTQVDWYVQNILDEDALVTEALGERGLTAQRVDWARADVDWSSFGAAVFRTTWDYFERWSEFSAWLPAVAEQTRLVNPLSTVQWNADKHYLRDLAAKGIPVAPTEFLERDDPRTLGMVMAERGWPRVVLKPAVSGAARHTYRVSTAEVRAHEPILRERLGHEAMMVQPFLPDIVDRGEVTVVAIDGEPTHALLKRAKPGDFRVQDDHGGNVHAHDASPAELSLAAAAMAACDPVPCYGRVDMVRDPAGQLVVMELELIEPELWFRLHPPAAARLADALAARL